ncbi:hypothetical protein GBA52_018104 [Prunus armeniaca]|nr:hypothetical protein GBA52_018104 [Prunus armeniaca]
MIHWRASLVPAAALKARSWYLGLGVVRLVPPLVCSVGSSLSYTRRYALALIGRVVPPVLLL